MNKDNEDNFDNINYNLNFLRFPKWILILITFFLITLFSYFPIGMKIDTAIKSALNSVPGCSIKLEKYNASFFMPKVELHNISIPRRCAGTKANINIKKALVKFRGFSFSPFGPLFKLETQLFKNPISVFLVLGFGDIAVKIDNNNLNIATLKEVLPQVKLAGNIKINGIIKTNLTDLKQIQLTLVSKDLMIPAQNIMGFNLSSMRLNSLLLKINSDTKNKINIKKLVLGDEDADIRTSFNGKLSLEPKRITQSTISLKGEVAFSESFLKKYLIIKLFMNKYDKKDNFYQLRLKGPITRPKVDSPR